MIHFLRRTRSAGASLGLVVCLDPSLAQAQSLLSEELVAAPKDTLGDRAKELMRAGFAEYKKGKYEAARTAFAEAWALQRHGEVAGALAEVEMRLGLYADAAEHWDFYLHREPPDRDEAMAQLAECKKHVSLVSLTVRGDAEVLVNGAPVQMREGLGFRRVRDLWLSPGVHVFQARAGGQPQLERRVELRVVLGTESELDLTPPSPSPPAADRATQPAAIPVASGLPDAAPQVASSGGSNARVIVTVGGAVLAVGAVTFGVISGLRRNAAWDRRGEIIADLQRDATAAEAPNGVCAPDREDYPAAACAEIRAEISRYNSLTDTANVAFVAGGVLGVATIATFLLWPKEHRASERGRIVVSPLDVAGSQGLQIEKTF